MGYRVTQAESDLVLVQTIQDHVNTSYDNIKLVADNLATINNIGTIIRTHQVTGTPPTTRSDGTALVTGDTYFDPVGNVAYNYVVDTAAWYPIIDSKITRELFTISAGQ